MIRRDIRLANGEPRWLLVSQVEHARISGDLAKRCLNKFGQSAGSGDLSQVREELFAAIVHHDDGWTERDARPELDPEFGRPYSFREMAPVHSLIYWTDSIRTAEAIGDLAAWVVAGHFLALLESSKRVLEEPLARRWKEAYRKVQSTHFENWQEQNPVLHTRQLADEALGFLQLFDVMSLWLCSACPGGGERVSDWPESYCFGEGTALATEFSCGSPASEVDYPANEKQCRATIDPWRFDVEELAIDAAGWIVPCSEYASATELRAAMLPHRLRWLLTSKG